MINTYIEYRLSTAERTNLFIIAILLYVSNAIYNPLNYLIYLIELILHSKNNFVEVPKN